MAAFTVGSAVANDELIKMSQNPKDWVMPAGDYANSRYSKLNQITAANVGKLQVAWTFSTGVLRGHEGAPLVIGDVMYVHGPFPNPVYALDLAHGQGREIERAAPLEHTVDLTEAGNAGVGVDENYRVIGESCNAESGPGGPAKIALTRA